MGGSGTLSFDTTTPRSGTRCLQFAGTAASFSRADLVAGGIVAAASRIFIGRCYIRFPSSLPSKDALFSYCVNVGTTVLIGFAFNQALGTIECATTTSAAGAFTFAGGGVAVVADTWYRIDYQVRTDANPWTADARVDGVAVTQASIANAAANPAIFAFGVYGEGGTGAITVRFDDLAISQTDGDYPIGPGYVNHFTPTSDGAHNIAGADDFERTSTGTDITNATTDAYELVNDVPLETVATDFIRIIAPPNATDYVEVVFGPAAGISTPTTAPRVVSMVVGHHSAGTAANNLRVALRDNDGGTQADVFSKDISDTAMAWSRLSFTTIPGSTAWTVTAFNNLRARCYSSDAADDPLVDGYILEGEWAEVVAVTTRHLASLGVGT
jgi:hypothetical protein